MEEIIKMQTRVHAFFAEWEEDVWETIKQFNSNMKFVTLTPRIRSNIVDDIFFFTIEEMEEIRLGYIPENDKHREQFVVQFNCDVDWTFFVFDEHCNLIKNN